MKLGILETDHPEKTLQEKYGSYSEMFQALFSRVDDQLVFSSYDVTRLDYPADINECDAYLITGSKASPYEGKEWIRQLEDYVLALHSYQKKLIGICFGHQLIAQALGGLVKKNDSGWGVGAVSRDVFQQKPWMGSGEKTQFKILVSHQDQVTELPPGAERIAGNDFCPHASFQIGSHILTFQGHPEFQIGYLRHLITDRRARIGPSLADDALKSLTEKTDHQQVAQWIVTFLKT